MRAHKVGAPGPEIPRYAAPVLSLQAFAQWAKQSCPWREPFRMSEDVYKMMAYGYHSGR